MREADIERKFKKRVQDQGGLALKFVSPGAIGVPDRIVLLPGGRVVFAEIKRTGERTRPIQRKRISEFQALGHEVWVIDSENGIDRFIEEVMSSEI